MKFNRREMIRITAASALLVACNPVERSVMTEQPSKLRMPTVFLPHGGGPWPFMDDGAFGAPGGYDAMAKYMRELSMVPPTRPTAVIIVSAHWEARLPTVMTSAAPPMFYDYYGFPEETYHLQWPAPGAPEIAESVRARLEAAGIRSASEPSRGFDHGVFVPMMLAYPDANVPTFQLSLKEGLDPLEHIQIGRALEPLRDEGVFIVGSGMSYHNMRMLMASMRGARTTIVDDSIAFDEWLAETVMLPADQRETRLVEWLKAPRARDAHPREEHLLPLMVIAGAAGNDLGATPYRDFVIGAHVSAAHFG